MRKILAIRPTDPDPSLLQETATLILKGGVVAIPTDTFYGLAGNPFDSVVVRRLYEIKGRPFSKPILLLISDLGMLSSLVEAIPPAAHEMIASFWPGPLTLVFKASNRLPDLLTGGTGTVGVRFPQAMLPVRLIEKVGFPITATSANRSGEPSPTSVEEVDRTIGPSIDLILDGGSSSPLPSTVVDVAKGQPRLLREGRISAEQLAAFIGKE
ncbi:MAG: L-threonylcarbamoyladenylate synthase [Candidatus Manganitrophaceae bacterium]